MSVDVSTISSSSYMWCYHFFSQRKQIQVSSIILLLLPIRIFQQPKYKCIYGNSVKVQHLVDLVQVYSFISLSRTSTPLRNNAGISGLFFLSVPTTVMFLDKRNFASSQLVKKLSIIPPLLVPYMWQAISFTTWRPCFFSLTPPLFPVYTCMLQASAATHNLIPYFPGFDSIRTRNWHLSLNTTNWSSIVICSFCEYAFWNVLIVL